MANNNSNSAQDMIEFIGNNFGTIFLIMIFFIGGFMGGSLWTENQILKKGQDEQAQVAKGGDEAPTAQGENEVETGLSQDSLTKQAEEIGLDPKKFTACLEEDRYKDKVDAQIKGAKAVGISGTPRYDCRR